jgi:hypothetical protein
MKRLGVFGSLILVFAAWGEDPPAYAIMMRQHTLPAAMAYYEHLTGKKVQIAEGVSANVTIISAPDLSKAGAIAFIEQTLLERHGIALRTGEKGEVIAEWSKDPKYPHSVQPRVLEKDAKATPPPRIRILGKEEPK